MAKRITDRPLKKRGPAPWEPTDEERRLIEHYVSMGYTQEQCAALIGKTVDTLAKHCREELDLGSLKVNAKIGGKLFQKAMGGDTGAIIWWEKTRSGFKERIANEHTGANGGPIQHEQVTSDAESFTGRILGLAARQGTPGGTGETKH